MSQFTNSNQLTSVHEMDFQPRRDDTARFLSGLWKKKLPEMMPIEPNGIPESLRVPPPVGRCGNIGRVQPVRRGCC